MEKDWVQELVCIMARLRGPGGCPWDREQTHGTLKRYLAEESAELFEAIDEGDDAGICEELGDVLLQVVFHSQIGAEEGRFDLNDAARVCCEKMIRRHPHVFGEVELGDREALDERWHLIKEEEKRQKRRSGVGGRQDRSAIGGVPRQLPALHRAQKLQQKAARVGFAWPDVAGAIEKIDEEWSELKAALAAGSVSGVGEEIGDVLFAVANLSRYTEHHAEECLSQTIRKFERRFRQLEALLRDAGRRPAECGLEELERLWQAAKRADCPVSAGNVDGVET